MWGEAPPLVVLLRHQVQAEIEILGAPGVESTIQYLEAVEPPLSEPDQEAVAGLEAFLLEIQELADKAIMADLKGDTMVIHLQGKRWEYERLESISSRGLAVIKSLVKPE